MHDEQNPILLFVLSRKSTVYPWDVFVVYVQVKIVFWRYTDGLRV